MLSKNQSDYRKIKIESARLILKDISLKHRQSFYKLFSDTNVLRYTDRPVCKNIDEAILYLKKSQERASLQEHLFLGIFIKDIDELIGVISIYHIDLKHSFSSLGILLAKEYWRKGLMTEALSAFLNYYFTQLNFNRIELQTFVKNIPAIRLFEKMKFQKEGRLRKNFLIAGNYEDSFLYSMLKEEFYLNYK